MIRELWLPWVIIGLIIGHCKTRNVRLAGQQQKNDVTQQLQNKKFERFLNAVSIFAQFWCNLRYLVTRSNHLVKNWSY